MTDEDRELSKDELDVILKHLHQQNTLAAIAYGVQVGQAAINEVLRGGPKVLGEKLTRQEQLEGLADRGCDTWDDYLEKK